jgi:hypothetical protein
VGICLARRIHDLPNTVCVKTFITYVRETVPTPTATAAGVFGTGIFH